MICSNATDESVPVHIAVDGEAVHLSGIPQLSQKDIQLEDNFTGCTKSEDGLCRIAEKCQEWILDGKWKDTFDSSGQGEGKENLSREMSYMICSEYGGYICFDSDGQNVRTVIEEEEIEISSWLMAYKGEPELEDRDIVKVFEHKDLKEERRQELGDRNLDENGIRGIDWYSYMQGLNPGVEEQFADNRMVPVIKPTSGGTFVNEEGRYWIGVGPEILYPGYLQENDPDKAELLSSEFAYGTEIDVVLRYENTNNLYYIKCIVGEVKAHTYPDGTFQTGIPFPNSPQRNEDGSAHRDGSYIEFLHAELPEDSETDKKKIPNGEMSTFSVERIIVYERKW